jgi:hypothetical protein
VSFFKRKVFEHVERRFAALMVPGERMVDFEVASLGNTRRANAHLIVTDRALILADDTHRLADRIPFERVASVSWDPGNALYKDRFVLRFYDRQDVWGKVKPPAREALSLVQQRVEALVVAEHRVEFEDGEGAVFRARPTDERGELKWLVAFDEGLDDDDAEVDAWVRETIQRLRSSLPEVPAGRAQPEPSGPMPIYQPHEAIPGQDLAQAMMEGRRTGRPVAVRDHDRINFVFRTTSGAERYGVLEEGQAKAVVGALVNVLEMLDDASSSGTGAGDPEPSAVWSGETIELTVPTVSGRCLSGSVDEQHARAVIAVLQAALATTA